MNKLYWKAFVLYAVGLSAICNLLLLPVVLILLFWLASGTGLDFFFKAWIVGSILTGGIVSLMMISLAHMCTTSMDKRRMLADLAEEGRLMIIYGNIIGALFLLICVGRIMWREYIPVVVALIAYIWDSTMPDENLE